MRKPWADAVADLAVPSPPTGKLVPWSATAFSAPGSPFRRETHRVDECAPGGERLHEETEQFKGNRIHVQYRLHLITERQLCDL